MWLKRWCTFSATVSSNERTSRLSREVVLLVGIFLLPPLEPLAAQDGTVQGRVRDDEGTPVYNATVVLRRSGTPVVAVDTDRLGSFRFFGVTPGPYTVGVQALGYTEYSEEIVVDPAETLELEVRLERNALLLDGISVEAERNRARVVFETVGGATIRDLDLEAVRTVPALAEPDPVRALEVLPGVVSTSDFSASFHVRGGSQDQNLILLDGMPIYSPFHLGGIFSVFNADMIDRVELYSGGFPAEHGGRVSSVLQVESDSGDGDFSGVAAVSLLATRVAIGGGLGTSVSSALGFENIHYRVSARRSYIDVLAPQVPYHLTDFQGLIEGWTTGGDRIALTGYVGRDVFDLTNLDDEDFPLRIDWDWGNDAIGVRWTHPRRGGGSLDVRANFSRFSTGLAFPDCADTRLSSRIKQGQFRADLDLRPTEHVSVQVGTSVEVQDYKNLFSSGGTDFATGIGNGLLLGAYVQTRWSPDVWLVELGLRADGYDPDPGSRVGEISPRLAVQRFLGAGDLAVKLAVGRYTQFVHSLRDEELPLGLDFWMLAGARAPHTISDQIQAGIEGYRGDNWFWSVEAYARSFDGVVTFNTAENPNDDFDDVLSGEGFSYGVDLLIRRETGEVTGWMDVSFLNADRTFPDPLSPLPGQPEVSYAPIFDRRVDVDFVLSYPAPWGWEGGIRWNLGTGIPYTNVLGSYQYYDPRYVGGRGLQWSGAPDPTDPEADPDDNGDFGVILGDRNSVRYPSYHRLDLSFRRTFDKSWGSLTPYINLLNVYNRQNVLFYFFEYERTPATRSGVSMFPLLPTFGLEVRF